MDIYSKIFSGFFAYLLIAQIFVVSGLMLYLLGMLAKRISRMVPEDGQKGAQVIPMPAIDVGVEKDLRDKIAKLEADAASAASAGAGGGKDQAALVDKIKYLESKLLEYEILQEEIGQLSNLKNENESLRAKVQELETKTKAA